MKPLLVLACSFFIFARPASILVPGDKAGTPSSGGAGIRGNPAYGANYGRLYDSLELNILELSRDAFRTAVRGYRNLVAEGQIRNCTVLSIIDFSLPSNKKRLFVLDMANGKLLFNTLVAHGRNSGKLMATRFSNRPNSYMSSLGFYITGDPFSGQHGYSLRLEGIEKGINSNAAHRSIILHSAPYVSQDHIEKSGFLGRSQGCPAIPEELDRDIIETIRDGSCLFLYSPQKKYTVHSKYKGLASRG
jgi:hypothetical protein